MPFPNDILHTLHRRQRRTSQNSPQNHSPRRHATLTPAQKPHGQHNTIESLLLHLNPKYHPRRSRPCGSPQISPPNPRKKYGKLHTLGSCKYPSSTYQDIAVHPNLTSSQRIDARESYFHIHAFQTDTRPV